MSLNTGVNLIGYARSETGLGEALRSLARSLRSVQVPVGILDFETGNPGSLRDDSLAELESISSLYNTSVLVINPDNLDNAVTHLPRKVFTRRKVVGYWFWELEEIPDWWLPAFSVIDELWVASTFIQEAVLKKVRVPIVSVPLSVETPPLGLLSASERRARRERFGLPVEGTLFLTSADPLSYLERKNPLGAVRAFKKAFPTPGDPRACLALKVPSPKSPDPHFETLMKEIQGYSNIVWLDRIYRRAELSDLFDACDVFVALYRAEGFGLMPAEAMARGKPVIATAWSGPTDYLQRDNSFPIDFKLVALGKGFDRYYRAEDRWADPDLDQAAMHMRELVTSPDLGLRIGARARRTMQEEFSPRAIGERLVPPASRNA